MDSLKKDKVLLINPTSLEIYQSAKVKAAAPQYPPLNLVTLAASIRKANVDVEIIDLQTVEDPKKGLKKRRLYKNSFSFFASGFKIPCFLTENIVSKR